MGMGKHKLTQYHETNTGCAGEDHGATNKYQVESVSRLIRGVESGRVHVYRVVKIFYRYRSEVKLFMYFDS
jgi:hypothetical protein